MKRKKVVFSTVIIDEPSLIRLNNTFEQNGYDLVCVITHHNWMPIVKKVLPEVELHWFDNFLHFQAWDFPLLEDAVSVFGSNHTSMPLALTERHDGVFGVLESETRLLHQASLAEDILNRHKPDLYISWQSVERALDYALFSICKKRGIPVLLTKSAGFKRLIACSTEFYSPVVNPDGSFHSSTVSVNNLKEGEKVYPFIQQIIESMQTEKKSIFQIYESTSGNNRKQIPPFSKQKYIWESIRSIGFRNTIRTIILNGLLRNDAYFKRVLFFKYNEKVEKFIPNPNKRYIYFPLHLQPELTTMPIGMEFYNQVRAIKVLSDSIEEDIVILVKEHPSTFSTNNAINRRFKFENGFEWLKAIPKVQLVATDADSNELIKSSFAIATINGNIAAEAIMAQKPVLIFTQNYLMHAPGIYYVSDGHSIKQAFESIQNSNITIEEVNTFMEHLCKNVWCMARDNHSKVIYNDIIVPEITSVIINGFLKWKAQVI
jgi:hypothetical protein